MRYSMFAFLACGLFKFLQQTDSIDVEIDTTVSQNSNNLSINLLIDQTKINLQLTQNNLVAGAQVLLGKDFDRTTNLSTVQRWTDDNTEGVRAYQDPASGTAFVILPDSSIQGTIRHGSNEYYIKSSSAQRRKRSTTYKAIQIRPEELSKPTDRDPRHPITITSELRALMDANSKEKQNYISEIVMIVDYSVFKKWYDLTSSTLNKDQRQSETISMLQYYYTSVANAMDLRYSNIKENDFSIRIKLNGILISTSDQASPWTQNYLINVNNRLVLYTYKAIDDMPMWVKANRNNLPQFDNLLVFTSHDMFAGYTNGMARFISGLANIQAVCNEDAVSFNKENGEFASAGTAAHELAHNLGSLHDILSLNLCNPVNQYIMSPAPGEVRPGDELHPFQFSPCSIDYLRTYLGALTFSNKNCLLQTSAIIDTSKDIPTSIPHGQYFKIDSQCQQLLGRESFYCGGMENDEKMCSFLVCYDPVERKCTTRTEYRAASGTTCGNKKWCSSGSCIYHTSAPVASDICLSGDYRGPDFDCKILLFQDPSKCYDEHYAKICCAYCDNIKQSDSSCLYGDRNPSYCSSIEPVLCYSNDIRNRCCQKCYSYIKTTIKGCEYGDRASWCAASAGSSSTCYTDNNTCCFTCASNYLGHLGCEYGDKAGWCPSSTKDQCSIVSKDCCLTCNPQLRKTKPDMSLSIVKPTTTMPSSFVCSSDKYWCSKIPPSYCYTDVSQSCSCACQNYRSISNCGCEYGSKFIWCKNLTKNECRQLADPNDCCMYCSSVRDSVSLILIFAMLSAVRMFASIGSKRPLWNLVD